MERLFDPAMEEIVRARLATNSRVILVKKRDEVLAQLAQWDCVSLHANEQQVVVGDPGGGLTRLVAAVLAGPEGVEVPGFVTDNEVMLKLPGAAFLAKIIDDEVVIFLWDSSNDRYRLTLHNDGTIIATDHNGDIVNRFSKSAAGEWKAYYDEPVGG